MKYMISTYASQQDYDGMAGNPGEDRAWSAEDFAAMTAFMDTFNKDLDYWRRRSSARSLGATGIST